jgi:hypothetical protein
MAALLGPKLFLSHSLKSNDAPIGSMKHHDDGVTVLDGVEIFNQYRETRWRNDAIAISAHNQG